MASRRCVQELQQMNTKVTNSCCYHECCLCVFKNVYVRWQLARAQEKQGKVKGNWEEEGLKGPEGDQIGHLRISIRGHVRPSVCLLVRPTVCQLVCLSLCPSVRQFVHPVLFLLHHTQDEDQLPLEAGTDRQTDQHTQG